MVTLRGVLQWWVNRMRWRAHAPVIQSHCGFWESKERKSGRRALLHPCLKGETWCRGRAAAKKEADSSPKPAKRTR